MKIKKSQKQVYKEWYEKNKDTYGKECFKYAERWADLMEYEIKNSDKSALEVIDECAERTSKEADKNILAVSCLHMLVSLLKLVGNMAKSLLFGEVKCEV